MRREFGSDDREKTVEQVAQALVAYSMLGDSPSERRTRDSVPLRLRPVHRQPTGAVTLMRVFLLFAGVLLLLSSLRLRTKARTIPSVLYMASLVCGGLGLMIWVPENSLDVDRLLHTPGVGHLLTIWLISLCFLLQFAFITLLTARGQRRHLWAYMIHAALLALFTLACIAVRITLGGTFGTIAYGAYAGGPWPVVVMDCAGSLSIVVPGLLGAWGYLRFLMAGHRLDERLGAA
ncbi:MAG: hypothetical protein ACRDGS_06740, partial [Chloroflexota bacterium]